MPSVALLVEGSSQRQMQLPRREASGQPDEMPRATLASKSTANPKGVSSDRSKPNQTVEASTTLVEKSSVLSELEPHATAHPRR